MHDLVGHRQFRRARVPQFSLSDRQERRFDVVDITSRGVHGSATTSLSGLVSPRRVVTSGLVARLARDVPSPLVVVSRADAVSPSALAVGRTAGVPRCRRTPFRGPRGLARLVRPRATGGLRDDQSRQKCRSVRSCGASPRLFQSAAAPQKEPASRCCLCARPGPKGVKTSALSKGGHSGVHTPTARPAAHGARRRVRRGRPGVSGPPSPSGRNTGTGRHRVHHGAHRRRRPDPHRTVNPYALFHGGQFGAPAVAVAVRGPL